MARCALEKTKAAAVAELAGECRARATVEQRPEADGRDVPVRAPGSHGCWAKAGGGRAGIGGPRQADGRGEAPGGSALPGGGSGSHTAVPWRSAWTTAGTCPRAPCRSGLHLRGPQGAEEGAGDPGAVEQPADAHGHGLPGHDAGESGRERGGRRGSPSASRRRPLPPSCARCASGTLHRSPSSAGCSCSASRASPP